MITGGQLYPMVSAFAVTLLLTQAGHTQEPFPRMEGHYMGQAPPGTTPEIFLPGVLNRGSMGAFCTVFSPVLDEFFFVVYQKGTEGTMQMHRMESVGEVWSAPVPLRFSRRGMDNDMCLSVDGVRMVFRSWRSLPDGQAPQDHSWLWMADRESGVWRDARPVLAGGTPVNSGYPALSADGTLYFRYRMEAIQGIYRAEPQGGQYGPPQHVTTMFHADFIHGDMFVAPDESYMIVSGMEPEGPAGPDDLDLFILFGNVDGSWSEAIDLGPEINTPAGENCPQVSPDGNFFFFNRYDAEQDVGNMYWVDAKVLEGRR